MNWNERKVVYISIIISILLHLLGLLLFKTFDLFAFSETKNPDVSDPLELVFEQPVVEEKVPEDEFYEVVENPNASGQSPEKSNKLSTESSLSQAPAITSDQIRAVPGTVTDETDKSSQSEQENQASRDQEAIEKSLLAYRENRSFSRSALTGRTAQSNPSPEDQEQPESGETLRRPEGFDADLVGDFALSTYEWEWAPYWLAFKRKLNRVWYAPPAYYELGLIHGHTILRFEISRDGYISDLEVLRQVGHSSLESSSVNAIEAVFPFLPLPADFPDPYLEVTLKMIYPNLRELNVRRK